MKKICLICVLMVYLKGQIGHAQIPTQIPTPTPITSIPVKNKFLDYIYLIRPDHKAKEYSIDKEKLAAGYAFGRGPYDGWRVEFFLFRGENRDLVFEQLSGFEVNKKEKTYGVKLVPYAFENMKMSRLKLSEVWPLKEIEKLYSQQIIKLKKDKRFNKDWKYYKIIKLPIEGTLIQLKACRKPEEGLMPNDTVCATIGELKWNNSSFTIQSPRNIAISTENYDETLHNK